MKKILMTIMAVLLTTAAHAELSPATYFEIEIKARELTITGMRERLTCMQDLSCPDSQAAEIDEASQTTISNMYQGYNTTPSRIATYYTQNSQAVDDYFRYNIELQVTMNQLTATFESVSDEIKPLLEEQ
jgi:hypothetical protein